MDRKLKVSLIGALDMLKFKNLAPNRRKAIEAAPAKPLPKTIGTNEKAIFMHPRRQLVRIKDKIPNGPDAVTVVLEKAEGGALAPFRAGQYISVSVSAGETRTTRSYSLCGSPDWAWQGIYHITVKRVEDDGFVSQFIQDEWTIGQEIAISAPQGHLYYEPIRDGYEDFDLTILSGSRKEEDILYRKELDAVAAACDKVHIVHVLSDEAKPGFEQGFITAELIRKYAAGEPYSVFMCGPQAMYTFLDQETAKLGLDHKHVRRELFGMIKDPWNQPDYPAQIRGKTFRVKVILFDQEFNITASADEPLLTAFDRAGIKAPSRCRSGECGWCRSRLLEGQVYVPAITDGRRGADKDFGYIHPCSSFAMSDLVVELPGQYQS